MDKQIHLYGDFQRALNDCRRLYRSSGELIVRDYPHLAWKEPRALVELMDSLHAGLLMKTYFTIALADQKWSKHERVLSQLLIAHLWNEELEGADLRAAAEQLSRQTSKLNWYGLVRPFAEVPPLRERSCQVETIVVRVANLVAKVDGKFSSAEERMLHTIQHDLELHLRPLPVDVPAEAGPIRIQNLQDASRQVRKSCQLDEHQQVTPADEEPPREFAAQLPELLKELQSLIGLRRIKHEIKTLSNLIRLSQQRAARGLPQTDVSLHMVFTGNPGTGKTTVARLVARILQAMGVLKKGHLIETDRSGLVAEYAGQTGPKTNQRIDEALDGVLFIDEAYSLVAQGEDAFGREALQALLKRMEDDRDRLVVILAGYPEPMRELLAANPGLESRFNRHLAFDDYDDQELAAIFERLCDENHFELPGPVRARLLIGFRWLFEHRDQHFGNGRMARNIFENAVRRLANRIAGSPKITHESLTVFQPPDIDFPDVPTELLLSAEATRFRVECPGCHANCHATARLLGRRVRCKCGQIFTAAWGTRVDSP